MGNTFTAVTGKETKQKFSFIMHSHKLDFIKVCEGSHGSGKKSGKSLNIKLLLSKDGKRWLLV